MYNKTKIDLLNRKLKTIDELTNLDDLSNKSVAVLGGVYDLCHSGHLSLIAKAKEHADITIVAINSDESVKQLKGESRPIIPEDDRAFFIASLEFVDYVTIFNSTVIDEVLIAIQPKYFVKSTDYHYDKMTQSEKDIFQQYNIQPLFIPLYKDYSTTSILAKLKDTI